jgi:HSP20 family protein
MNLIKYHTDRACRHLDDMRAEINGIFDNIEMGKFTIPTLIGNSDFKVDVRETSDEVIVVADLPGIDGDTVNVRLINPRALEISCGNSGVSEDSYEGYYLRERVYSSMRRNITLPANVAYDGYMASFKNGTLEVHLTKAEQTQTKTLEITKN